MRSTTLVPVIVALLALAAGLPRARAQGYVVAPRATYAAPAPRYYVQPRTYYVPAQPAPSYVAVPQRRGLLRVRKYPITNTTYRDYILVDPNNRHWTFDYDQWMAHNF
jgi:hypothetical protein